MQQVDYLAYYNLEAYLFDTVHRAFQRDGSLSSFDFFCIVIWKANRAKSKVAAKLMGHTYSNLNEAVHALTTGIARQGSAEDRLRYLMEEWGLRLPMASAILTVLYPQEFTVYDIRVCSILGDFDNLGSVIDFERLWTGYQKFLKRVREQAPDKTKLRDKDRYLWGKSFHDQLNADISRGFKKVAAP